MRSNRFPSILLATACVFADLSTITLVGDAGQAARSDAASQSPGTADKVRVLNDLIAQQTSVPHDQIAEIVGSALMDPDAGVRERALRAVARRAGSPTDTAIWEQERLALKPFRSRALELLEDPDGRVREAAAAALCSLDVNFAAPRESQRILSTSTARAILSALQKEQSEGRRARLLSVFGNFKVRAELEEQRDAVLTAALNEKPAAIVGAAVIAVWNVRSTRHLPVVVRTLGHDSSNVRILAAQAIASFGADARQFVPSLERALVVETNELAKQTLRGAVAALVK